MIVGACQLYQCAMYYRVALNGGFVMNSANETSGRKSRLMTATLALGIASLLFPSGASADHRIGASLGIWTPKRASLPCDVGRRGVTVLGGCKERPRRVWREPIYEIRRIQVEIPPVVVSERIPRYNRWGEVVGYDLVERVIEPARRVWKNARVLIQPGYWDTVVQRVCGRAGHGRGMHRHAAFRPAPWAGQRHLKIQKSRPRHRWVRSRRPG